MPPLPSPAQAGLREPPHPWGTVYKNLLKNLFDRGWLASYDRDKADLIGLPRPVKIHGNYSASEIGADRLNDFLPYDIFCVHAAVPTNDLEKCRIKVHLNQQVNGMVVDALSPSTHSCAYTIVVKNAMRKSFPDLFLDKKLIIPVINYTDPLVVHCLENPYRALLGVPRANPGFDYQNEFQVPPPPAIPQPVPAPPVYRPPRAASSAPLRAAPSAPPRAAPSAPPRATPSASSHASPSAPPRAAPGPSSSRTDAMSSAQKISQKRKSNNESDDEVEVIWQGHVEPRGNKPMPIDVDSYPSPPQWRRQRSPAISDSWPSSQAQKNSKIISVIPLGNRANDLDMLSAKQVAAGKAIDHALIKATEALFDLGHYNKYPKSHPGHPDTAHVSLDPYRTISAENIIGYFNEYALQGLLRSTVKCSSCLRVFEGEAMLKHYVLMKGIWACAHGESLKPVSALDTTSRAKLHISPASLIVPQQYANTFDTSVEFPDDALTVAWALWASYIGVPEDVFCLLSTGYLICEKCKRARTFVAHEAHLHICFQ
ncbi:hypothetical protein BDZ89DRAFT_1138780 [Hymenopellis radicata]|nr:hypothetical protein BDZ89DRAFT_1138780 [Hymenopellis radicata]